MRMKNHNYMNSAGAAIVSDRTIEVITDYLKLEQQIGGYEAMFATADEQSLFYTRVQKLINAGDVSEIAYTDGGSRGWNSLLNGLNQDKVNRYITLSSEYVTNITTLKVLADRHNKSLHIIPCELDGSFDINVLESWASKGKCCIAISEATAQGSILNPIIEVGNIAQKHNAIYIVDGTQSTGQIPIDVQTMQCHAFTANGRKWLRGPRGTGFMYIKTGSPFTSQILDGSSSKAFVVDGKIQVEVVTNARQFEMWERCIANMLGLSQAIKEYLDLGPEKVHHQIVKYANQIREAISNNNNLNLVGKRDSLSGIVGFVAKDEDTHNRVHSLFTKHDITIGIMHEWACPLFFGKKTQVYRLAAHHDVSQEHVNILCNVILKV